MNNLRGHKIEKVDGVFVYSDTLEPTAGNRRNCELCKIEDTEEGHDPCIGTLPNVKNACCGHGNIHEAYVQMNEGTIIEGMAAIKFIHKNQQS